MPPSGVLPAARRHALPALGPHRAPLQLECGLVPVPPRMCVSRPPPPTLRPPSLARPLPRPVPAGERAGPEGAAAGGGVRPAGGPGQARGGEGREPPCRQLGAGSLGRRTNAQGWVAASASPPGLLVACKCSTMRCSAMRSPAPCRCRNPAPAPAGAAGAAGAAPRALAGAGGGRGAQRGAGGGAQGGVMPCTAPAGARPVLCGHTTPRPGAASARARPAGACASGAAATGALAVAAARPPCRPAAGQVGGGGGGRQARAGVGGHALPPGRPALQVWVGAWAGAGAGS